MSRLFGCFKNIRAWQSSNGPLAQSICEAGRASQGITSADLRKGSNSVIASCDRFAASQHYTSNGDLEFNREQ